MLVEEFFHEATYVVKNLWRDELLPAKYSLDNVMKLHYLSQALEWRVEIDHNWNLRTGVLGRGLKNFLDPQTWSELEDTYVGAGLGENWQAMFNTIDLFRKVAVEVGDQLGYPYPQSLDRRAMESLRKVRKLDRGAQSL